MGRTQSPMPLTKNAPRFAALTLSVITIACLAVGCTQKVDDSTIRRTTIAEVQTLLERQGNRLLLIDSRPQDQVAAGTIPGAVSIRPGDITLTQRDPWLNSFSMLVVFGQNPGSTTGRAVAKRLMTARYSDVRLLEAGLDGWKARGLPVGEAGTVGKGPAH